MFSVVFLVGLCFLLMCSHVHGGESLFDMGGWNDVSTDISNPKPYPPKSDSWKQPETPFLITLASYRDDLCGITIKRIFDKAKYPDRVRIGVS